MYAIPVPGQFQLNLWGKLPVLPVMRQQMKSMLVQHAENRTKPVRQNSL
jgi:hypothetical protein